MMSPRQLCFDTVIKTNLNSRLLAVLTERTLTIIVVILSMLGSGWAGEKTIVTFKGSNGNGPGVPVIFDAAGNLYGTTSSGGPNGNGVVFKLTPTAHGQWKERLPYTFGTM